jgi:hypothetical protein
MEPIFERGAQTVVVVLFLFIWAMTASLGAGMDNVKVPSEASTIPEPIPPVYDRLKDLHLTTPLVAEGQAAITLVAPASGLYQAEAEAIQAAIRKITGVQVPLVSDTAPAAAVPLRGHLILLGNRSTNRAISALYDLAYTFLDPMPHASFCV